MPVSFRRRGRARTRGVGARRRAPAPSPAPGRSLTNAFSRMSLNPRKGTSTLGVAGESKVVYRRRKPRRGKVKRAMRSQSSIIKKASAPMVYSNIGSVRYVGTTGNGYLMNIAQAYDAFDLSKIQTMVGDAGKASGGTYQLPNKYLVSSFRGEYSIKSGSNIDQVIDMYWYVPKRDLSVTQCPLQNTSTPTGSTFVWLNPLQTLIDGYAEQSLGSSVTVSTWPVGLDPFQIRKFCECFTILKVVRVMLGGGRNETISLKSTRPKLFDGTLVGDPTSEQTQPIHTSTALFKGKSIGIFGIARGVPINDSSTTTNVSTGPVNVLLSAEERYVVYNVSYTTAIVNTNGSFSTISTGSTVLEETEAVSSIETS